MVRTKADGAAGSRKVVAAAAPRKTLGSSGSSLADSPAGKGKYAGGNPVCPRPTPEWQKGIMGFLQTSSKDKENTEPDEVELVEDIETDKEKKKEDQEEDK